MSDATPTRLKIKLPTGEVEFEGSETFLKRLMPRLLRDLTQSARTDGDERIKAALLTDVEELQQAQAAQDALVQGMAQLFEASDALRERANSELARFIERLETAAAGDEALLEATKQMQETQMSFNLQYLQLQSQMQHENRSYTAISNIMKTKHDTVKNSISNIR